MASTKSLTVTNLAALGAPRLAALLIEISAGDAAAKRRLRLELAGTAGAAEVAREVRKRLAVIAKARSFVDWQKIKPLVADLEGQHRAIIDHVAKADPGEALDLLWRFLALADPVLARCDDSNGRVIDVFHAAVRDLAPLAEAAQVAPRALAQRMFEALCDNGYGQYDDLIELLAGRLGGQGLDHLKALFVALAKTPPIRPRDEAREVIGWGSGGPLYADQIDAQRHERTVRIALQDIADAQGKADRAIGRRQGGPRRTDAGREHDPPVP